MAERRDDVTDQSEDEFSFLPILRTLWSYRRVMLAAFLAVIVGYFAVMLVLYARMPQETLASIGFRLTFDGAEQDKYPNGTKFSSAEIIASPVLQEVFAKNDLQRYTSYQDFKDSLFVIQSNTDLDMLAFEYQAKLSDTRLTPVDRERVEEEFRQKRGSLKTASYLLSMRRGERVVRIPQSLLDKVLQNILSTWAQQAADRKGATGYNVPVLSKNSLKLESIEGRDFVVAADMLRNMLERVVKSLDEMAKLPGADATRLPPDQVSLADLHAHIEDLIRFSVEPLMAIIRAEGLSRKGARPDLYFQDRLFDVQLNREEVRQRIASLQDALNAYQQTPGLDASTAGGDRGAAVSPQLSESFIDRLVQLSTRANDVKYRQDITDRLMQEGTTLADLNRQADYYQSMAKAFTSLRPSNGSEEGLDVKQRIQSLYNETAKSMERVEAFYKLLSQHSLNPDTVLYSVTSPFVVQRTSSLTLRTVLLYLFIVLTGAVIVIPLLCLAHDYFRHWISPSRRSRGTLPASGV